MDSTKNCSAAENACSTSGFNELHAPKKRLQTSEVSDGKRSVAHEEKDGRKKFKTSDELDNLEDIGSFISPNLDQSFVESMLFKSPNMKELFDWYINISERIFMTMFLENGINQSSFLPKLIAEIERLIEEKIKEVDEVNKKNKELELKIKNCQEEFKKKEDTVNVLKAEYSVLTKAYERRKHLKELLEEKDNLLKKKTEEANLLRMSGEQIKKKIMEIKKEFDDCNNAE